MTDKQDTFNAVATVFLMDCRSNFPSPVAFDQSEIIAKVQKLLPIDTVDTQAVDPTVTWLANEGFLKEEGITRSEKMIDGVRNIHLLKNYSLTQKGLQATASLPSPLLDSIEERRGGDHTNVEKHSFGFAGIAGEFVGGLFKSLTA